MEHILSNKLRKQHFKWNEWPRTKKKSELLGRKSCHTQRNFICFDSYNDSSHFTGVSSAGVAISHKCKLISAPFPPGPRGNQGVWCQMHSQTYKLLFKNREKKVDILSSILLFNVVRIYPLEYKLKTRLAAIWMPEIILYKWTTVQALWKS